MSINNYIERQLIRRSMGTYFRRGKWILHVLFVLLFWFIFMMEKGGGTKELTWGRFYATAALLLPFLFFFYIYCLYLIPFCFKQNKLKKFWTLLLLLLLIFPLIDYGLTLWAVKYMPGLEEKMDKQHPLVSLGKAYFGFITSFAGFTSLLYFMELLEGVSIQKETVLNQNQLLATELHLIKTSMNPQFMIRSLDGIIQLSESGDEHTPASVVDFSDVLRYRLYRSKEKLVPLSDELIQLRNLMQLHNVLPGQENTSTLETEGDTDARVVPLSLINTIEPLLATFKTGAQWSLLVYLLMEEKEIQVAIELSTDQQDGLDMLMERIREDLWRLLYSGLNFTVEKEQNTYSLRTCIPIFRNSTVSS